MPMSNNNNNNSSLPTNNNNNNNNNINTNISNNNNNTTPNISNPDLRLLGTTVCHASSEDESFPATELNQAAGNAPHMAPRGWQSAKLGDFPQEIGLKFESGACYISQIQILAHQSKTPTRVDIFVFPPPLKKKNNNNSNNVDLNGSSMDPVDELLSSGMPLPSYHDATFHRLGYVTFRNNEVTKYRTRERKSVQLNVKAIYVRLVLHKCYANPVNLYSQVGIVALTAWGKPVGVPQNTFLTSMMTPPRNHNNNNSSNKYVPNVSSGSQQQQLNVSFDVNNMMMGSNNNTSGGLPPPPLSSTRNNNNSTNKYSSQNSNNSNGSNNFNNTSSPQQALQVAAAALQRSGNGPLAPVAPPPHHSRSMTRFSDWYASNYNHLNDAKTRAVTSEDFVLAKTIKDRMAWLAAQAAEINMMDSQKCAMADNEDYNSAQNLHMKQMQRIDLVIKLCSNAAPSDSVVALVTQMNIEMGIITAGATTTLPPQQPSTPNGKINDNGSNGKNNNNNNNNGNGRKQQKLQQLNRQQQQQQQNQNNNNNEVPLSMLNINDISNIQHPSNNNNQNNFVGGNNNNHTPDQQRGRKSTSPNQPPSKPTIEQQQALFNNMLTSPVPVVADGGNNQTESKHQQILNAEDQPIRSKFAIEMAKQRMQDLGAFSPNNTNANDDEAETKTTKDGSLGGTKAPSSNKNNSKKQKKNSKKIAAKKNTQKRKPKKGDDDSDESNDDDDDEEEDESESKDDDSSDDEDTTGKKPPTNRKELFDDSEGKTTTTTSNNNNNNNRLASSSLNPEDQDPNNLTNADLAPQIEGWEKDVMKLIEETASARFVSTGDPESNNSGGGNVPGQAPSSALQQQQRAENAGGASAGLHFVLGKFTAGCLFSRRWVMRESAICTVMNHLDVFAKHSKSATDVVEALLMYLDTKGYGLLDHVPSIFGVCRDFLVKILHAGESGDGADEEGAQYSSVNVAHLVPKIQNLLPRLLLKACEGAGKVKDESAGLILAIAKCPAIGPHNVLPFLTCQPVDADKKSVKTIMARHYQARLAILQVIYNFAYDDSSEACSETPGIRPLETSTDSPIYPTSTAAFDAIVGKFLIPCVNHASSEVRDPSVAILAHVLLHYLNDANNSNNATMKQKVLGTLRKLDNPVSKNILVNLIAPPRTAMTGTAKESGDGDENNNNNGIAAGRGATPTAAAGDNNNNNNPPSASNNINSNNNISVADGVHSNISGAKTAHPTGGHSKLPLVGGGAAAVVATAKNPRTNSNVSISHVRGGRTSTTPQPVTHHLNGGTPSQRNAPAVTNHNNNNAGGRRSITPSSQQQQPQAVSNSSNALPNLKAEQNPQFNIHGHSPSRQQQQQQQQQAGNNNSNPVKPTSVAAKVGKTSSPSHLAVVPPPQTNRTNNNRKAGSGPTTTSTTTTGGGRRAVGSVAAKNHQQKEVQQPNHGAHALGLIVGHGVN